MTKIFTLLLIFITLFCFNAKAQDTCGYYTITLEDSWIWGWEGGYIDIYVNGVLYADSVTIDQSNVPLDTTILMFKDDILSVDFTAGLSASENKYTVYDENLNVLSVQGFELAVPGDIGDFNIPSGLIACNTTAVHEKEKLTSFTILPNPSDGLITLHQNEPEVYIQELRVINSQGRVVIKKSSANISITETFDLSNQPAGIYFIEFNTSQGLTLQKLIIL